MRYLKTYENKNGITFKEWLEKNPKDLYTSVINCNANYLIDLNGIEDFKKLRKLYCSYNNLIELPDLSNSENLVHVYCQCNNLTELPDLSNLTNLRELSCYNNNLTELPDLSNLNNLKILYCFDNNLQFKCTKGINNLEEYIEWHKKEYPWIWDAKKYNL
jgi:Leucine-rich repeat (LRR) protein